VNVTLFVEGEEELGSAHLADHLAAHDLNADLVIVSDTMTWSADQPAICVGTRGMVKGEVRIDGPLRELHSGAVSGVAPNPVNELARVLGGLHDVDGRVAIPGFYDDVREISDDEKQELRLLSGDEAQWAARLEAAAVIGERGRSLAERLYARPSADVLSLAAGDTNTPTRGVLPTSASAQVQLSLVPDQDPGKVTAQLRRWIADEVAPAFRHAVEVPEQINQPPYATPQEHPAVAVLRAAMSQAWGREALRMRNAGGGPGALLAEAFDAPVLYFGTGLPEDRWHAADESVDIDVLLKGAVALALFWQRLPAAVTRPS
jgi:acetylornithine deacetylase/succinyl-diaminopimelate desuccinylase-like protein